LGKFELWLSGRAMARTGLRMMPTSPSSPLKFRTAGFPQYGFKAGPRVTPLGLRPPFVLTVCKPRISVQCRRRCAYKHRHASDRYRSTPGALALVRVLLSRSIITYWPHPPHSRAHPDFAARRLIRNVFAVRRRLGNPRLVPGFRRQFCLDMSPSETPGRPPVACAQFLRR